MLIELVRFMRCKLDRLSPLPPGTFEIESKSNINLILSRRRIFVELVL
jgi:hypothetical protein